MSTTQREIDHPPIDHNVKMRIRDFRNFTIAALRNFTVLIVFVRMLWFWIKAVPPTIPMPFILRWACIVCLYLGTIARNAWLFQSIVTITSTLMSKIEDEKRSPNRDLGMGTTNLEDVILANFCVIVGLSTMGFAAWYWVEVIALTVRSVFYWTCTMGGLCSLLWLLQRTIRFYRKVKGLKHDETWDILTGVNVLRSYNEFEGLKVEGVLGQFFDTGCLLSEALKLLLHTVGFRIGRGPLFDRLPDAWKAARRSCKTLDDLDNFYAIFAGKSDEEGDNKEDSQDRKNMKEAYFPPSVFEWQPNPVILPHLRGEYLQLLNSGPSIAKNTSDCYLMDTAGAAERFCSDMAVNLEYKGIPNNSQKSPGAPRHTGPTSMSANLSSLACPQCTYVSKKRFKLNKHIAQTHNRRFKCVYYGCGKIFGLRTNLKRHEATHTKRKYGNASKVHSHLPVPPCSPHQTFAGSR